MELQWNRSVTHTVNQMVLEHIEWYWMVLEDIEWYWMALEYIEWCWMVLEDIEMCRGVCEEVWVGAPVSVRATVSREQTRQTWTWILTSTM